MLPWLAALLLWTSPVQAAPRVLLYTMGSGDDLLSHYGHAVLCVRQDGETSGQCYDYGHTDYSSTVKVIWEFFRKKGMYWGEVEAENKMLKRYKRRDQSIWVQQLELTDDRAIALSDALAATLREDQKYYVYHHFYDNCSTRLRDRIDEATDGALGRGTRTPDGPSYREFAELGLSGFPPLQIALELGLGREADARTSAWDRMFLPEYLRGAVQSQLGVEPRQVNARKGPPLEDRSREGRHVVAGAGLALGLLAAAAGGRAPRLSRWVVGLGLGLPALTFWIAACITALTELRWNEALLVLWPTDLALARMGEGTLRRYLWGRAAVLALVATLWGLGVLIQPLGPVLMLAGLPVAAMLARAHRT